MVLPSIDSVVLVPFPFSDLSQSKLRPAIVLAEFRRVIVPIVTMLQDGLGS